MEATESENVLGLDILFIRVVIILIFNLGG